MSLFDNEPTSRPENDDGFFSWEERREIWADTEYIKYSDFMKKLYSDEEYYQLIEDIQDEEWWQKMQDGNLKSAIVISPEMKKIIFKEWPEVQEDVNSFYRDLHILRNNSRNKIRDSLSNFYIAHLKSMELLIMLAYLEIFMNIYTKNNKEMISSYEDLIDFEGIDFIRKTIGSLYSITGSFPIAFNDVFVFLLSGAQRRYDQDGKDAEKTHAPKPPKNNDDTPSFRRI